MTQSVGFCTSYPWKAAAAWTLWLSHYIFIILGTFHLVQCEAPQWCERWFRFAPEASSLFAYHVYQFVKLELLVHANWTLSLSKTLRSSNGMESIQLHGTVVLPFRLPVGQKPTSWDRSERHQAALGGSWCGNIKKTVVLYHARWFMYSMKDRLIDCSRLEKNRWVNST